MTKFFKSKKQALAKEAPKEPRSEADIRKEYADVALAAGQAQYQVYVYQRELDKLNLQLLNLNNEGAERQKLDRAAAEAAKQSQEEVNNERA